MSSDKSAKNKLNQVSLFGLVGPVIHQQALGVKDCCSLKCFAKSPFFFLRILKYLPLDLKITCENRSFKKGYLFKFKFILPHNLSPSPPLIISVCQWNIESRHD